jgi:hypothetical protein
MFFDSDIKNKRQINLGGNKKESKKHFLDRVSQEREARLLQKTRQNSAGDVDMTKRICYL